MKTKNIIVTYLILFICVTSYAQSTRVKTIKKAYEKALSKSQSYFEVHNIEITQEDFDKFMKKNKDLICKKRKLGAPRGRFGHPFTPVIGAEFTIKSVRNVKFNEKIGNIEGYEKMYTGNRMVACKYFFKRSGRELYLFGRKMPRYAKNYVDIKVVLDDDNKIKFRKTDASIDILSDGEVSWRQASILIERRVFTSHRIDVSRECMEMLYGKIKKEEEEAYLKAKNGTLDDFLDYYEKYCDFGYTGGREDIRNRLKEMFFSNKSFSDKRIEEERKKHYEYSYNRALKSIETVKCSGDNKFYNNIEGYMFNYEYNPKGFERYYHNKYDPKNYSKDLLFRYIKHLRKKSWDMGLDGIHIQEKVIQLMKKLEKEYITELSAEENRLLQEDIQKAERRLERDLEIRREIAKREREARKREANSKGFRWNGDWSNCSVTGIYECQSRNWTNKGLDGYIMVGKRKTYYELDVSIGGYRYSYYWDIYNNYLKNVGNCSSLDEAIILAIKDACKKYRIQEPNSY